MGARLALAWLVGYAIGAAFLGYFVANWRRSRRAKAAYSAAVTRAIQANKYANGMANANLAQLSANMTQYGGTIRRDLGRHK